MLVEGIKGDINNPMYIHVSTFAVAAVVMMEL